MKQRGAEKVRKVLSLFEIIPFSQQVCEIFGHFSADLKLKGSPIGDFDKFTFNEGYVLEGITLRIKYILYYDILVNIKRVTAIFRGRVQAVGYRDFVSDLAWEMDIYGQVENIKRRAVRIIAEGEEQSLNEFLKLININQYPIFVKEMVVAWGEASGEYDDLVITRGDRDEEFSERLDYADKMLHHSIVLMEENLNISKKSLEVSEKTLAVSEDSASDGKKMLEKQDQTISEIQKLNGAKDSLDYKLKSIEERLNNLEDTLKKANMLA